MSVCSICTPDSEGAASPRPRNPQLCDECQDWDDLRHVSTCLEQQNKLKPIDPLLFCYKHYGNWPQARKRGFCGPEELDFHGAEYYEKRGGSCMVCSVVREVLKLHSGRRVIVPTQPAHDEEEKSASGGSEARIAVWRCFVFDPLDHHRKLIRDEAVRREMLPYVQRCVLTVCLVTQNEHNGEWTYQPGTVELRLQYEEWCHNLREVSLWERPYLDAAQVTQWLTSCRQDHGPECSATPTVPKGLPDSFRLIDVLEKCVVKPGTSELEYTALSYVWSAASDSLEKQKLQLERGNLDVMSTPGGLREDDMPEVIVDAIRLCEQIGQRYLWVDRFCIVQDDPDLKTRQIEAMGDIYQQAFLSIVVLSDGPTRGLPGTASRPRATSMMTLENWSWDLLATRSIPMALARAPWIEFAIDCSRWNTRAWTFQERFFSRRRLYFDEGQVYGSCAVEMWHEKPANESIEKWKGQHLRQPCIMDDRAISMMSKSSAVSSIPICQYSSRSLTFPSDVMHAFAGVGSFIENLLNTRLLHGHTERYFTDSLQWIPYGDSGARRDLEGIPTWSWASWDGEVRYRGWVAISDSYLQNARGVKCSAVKFMYSSRVPERIDSDTGLEFRTINEEPQSMQLVSDQCERKALALIQKVAPSWRPASLSDKYDLMTLEREHIDRLIEEIRSLAKAKGWNQENSAARKTILGRQDGIHDPDEETCAHIALQVLDEHGTLAPWWLARDAMENDTEQLNRAYRIASQHAGSLVFTASCAYLYVLPSDRTIWMMPPRQHFTACHLIASDRRTEVGMSMGMDPGFAYQTFRPGPEGPKPYPVFVLGVCTAQRTLQFNSGVNARVETSVRSWDELCLLVMIAEEDEEQGVMRRLGVGIVYADVWGNINPESRTIVLV